MLAKCFAVHKTEFKSTRCSIPGSILAQGATRKSSLQLRLMLAALSQLRLMGIVVFKFLLFRILTFFAG